MNYKLAKQLKDAGFPQEKWIAKGKGEFKIKEAETTYVPTLSELIEACEPVGLGFILSYNSKFGWRAETTKYGFRKTGGGDNSKEATAKLFIELNKK